MKFVAQINPLLERRLQATNNRVVNTSDDVSETVSGGQGSNTNFGRFFRTRKEKFLG